MYLLPLPAFTDNYLWLLHDGKRALVVDPGDAAPVRAALAAHGLQLASILVTHHHADHVGGVDALREATGATVYGPARENIPRPFTPLGDGDAVDVLGLRFDVIDVPGHTAGHIAYYMAPSPSASRAAPPSGEAALARRGLSLQAGAPFTIDAQQPLLFCGDTLFSGGCGRLFEGTPAQMLASLDKLAALPGETAVCCAHEYTLSNLRFARAVDPGNAELAAYEADCVALRERGQPTLPATIAGERQINPFLRSRQPTIMAAARRFAGMAHGDTSVDDISVFAALRQWKNEFK